MDGQREILIAARETEIRELIQIAGMSQSYAGYCIQSGFTAERVRHDLASAVMSDPKSPLAAAMREQVKRGIRRVCSGGRTLLRPPAWGRDPGPQQQQELILSSPKKAW